MKMFRNFLRRTGFQRQLTLIVSASILGLAVFSALMNSWEANARMRDYFIGQGQRIADNLARQSTLALLFHSAENAREVVNSTLAFPDVAGLQIMDAKRKVLLSRVQGGARLDDSVIANAQPSHAGLVGENADGWLFAAPVYGGQAEASPFELQEHQQQLLGYVHVQIAKDTLKKLTWSLLLGNLALTLSFAIVLLVLGRLLTRHMINPLNALSTLMRRAESGESGMRAAPAGPRDLIEMAHAFNQMMNVLEQREAELKESRDAAVNMAQMKAQFAATVSHEVRTPLNGVVGMLDMLKETRLTQRQQEFVDVAWNSSRTLIALINNILDFSKMEAGKLTLEETDFALPALLAEVVELVARPAQQKGVGIGWSLAAGVPERIAGDALRLRQILINLAGNAVKFTERGDVSIHVALAGPETDANPVASSDDQAPFSLRFEVRDTGIGMNPETQRHLFEAYVQPDPSTTRRYGGTGLGLAICKQLVELLGGRISVQSVAGEGTTFTFTTVCRHAAPLPAGDAANNAGAAANEATTAIALSNATVQHGAPRALPARQFRVLVAEDNRTNQMVAAGMLAMNGCICEFAADGVEAVRAAQRERFDLILMDCSMPEMDGYEATAHIRLAELAMGRRTPLVAMTANTQIGDAEKCLAAGMDDYLAKPITLVELRHKLEKWLPHGGLSGAGSGVGAGTGQPVKGEDGHGVQPGNGAFDHAAAARSHAVRAAGNAPLDLNVFDKLRDVLGDSLPHAITPYLEDTPTCLDELEIAVRSGDMATARSRAHALKGSSGNFGAEALAQLALQAEQFAAAGQADSIAPLVAPLREHYHNVAAFLRSEISVAGEDQPAPGQDTPQVLMVDDDRSTRSTLRHTLQRDGFRVEEAADGQQALAMLALPAGRDPDGCADAGDGRLYRLRPHAGTAQRRRHSGADDHRAAGQLLGRAGVCCRRQRLHSQAYPLRRAVAARAPHHRSQPRGKTHPPPGLQRRADQPAEPHIVLRAAGQEHRTCAQRNASRWPYCSWTWTALNTSTTISATTVGDRLLQAVAQRVRNTVRAADSVARLGGDEFTVVLHELDSPASAATAAHNIVRMLAAPFPIDGHDIFVTASVGIAMYPHDGADVADPGQACRQRHVPRQEATTAASSSTKPRWNTRFPNTCGWRAICAARWNSSTSLRCITSRKRA
jgi:signal transduction histidine kinase/PleD family two-component response regulator